MLLTEQEARQKCCPTRSGCVASDCMAWRIGPAQPETRRSDPDAQAALAAWLRDNPAPAAPADDSDAAWEAYDQAAADWEAAALAFVASLVPGVAPGTEWEWRHGIIDGSTGDPYALWVRPAMERGYCGLAGTPEGH